jgi:serine/threonine protein kinase
MSEESSNTRSTAPGSGGAAMGGSSGLAGPRPVDVDAQHLLRTGAFEDGRDDSTRVGASAGLPRHIGHYRILGELGRGGFGVVYEGVHRALRFGGAIKVLKPRAGEGVAAWNEEEFLLEAARLARLREHEGIVRILDYGVHRDASGQRQPYFVMDLVPGGSEARLTTYARRVGLDLFGKLHLMAKVCDAVEHAHEHGLLHLDLKPGNILVWPRGLDGTPHQPKVIDLGIAQAMEPVADRPTQGSGTWVAARPKARSGVRGTYAYMSPEQTLEGSALDRRSDVYSLGVVLYELLCGRLPIDLSRCTDGDTMLDLVREAPADFDHPQARPSWRPTCGACWAGTCPRRRDLGCCGWRGRGWVVCWGGGRRWRRCLRSLRRPCLRGGWLCRRCTPGAIGARGMNRRWCAGRPMRLAMSWWWTWRGRMLGGFWGLARGRRIQRSRVRRMVV